MASATAQFGTQQGDFAARTVNGIGGLMPTTPRRTVIPHSWGTLLETGACGLKHHLLQLRGGRRIRARRDRTFGTQKEVTRAIARFIVRSEVKSLPKEVRREAVRTLLNWIGSAIGGARNEAVGIAVQPFAGTPQATIPSERIDALNAALVNGISSHVLDFDDTHLRTVIHPAAP
jgi:hypothetical protein